MKFLRVKGTNGHFSCELWCHHYIATIKYEQTSLEDNTQLVFLTIEMR